MMTKKYRTSLPYKVTQSMTGCILVLAGIQAARAGSPPQNLFVGGGSYSASSQFAYAGSIMPLGGGTLGKGFFVSPFASWGRYTFEKNGRTFTGADPSASLGFGYGWQMPHLDLSLSLAGGYSNTTVTPYAPPGSFHGGQWFAEPEIYAQTTLFKNASLTFNGGYLTGLRSYWSSTYLLIPATQSVSIGPEIDFGGGVNYRTRTYALRVADKISNTVGLDFSVGATTDLPGPYHPYVALNLSVPFQ